MVSSQPLALFLAAYFSVLLTDRAHIVSKHRRQNVISSDVELGLGGYKAWSAHFLVVLYHYSLSSL
jgi:hypothetical protein